MALIGGQILSSVKAAGLIERRQAAMLLAESITGRLQAGGFELSDQAQQFSGVFGDTYPGWGWRVGTETTDDPSLMRVHLQVLQGDPTQSNGTVDSMVSVTDLYTFWAIPAKMDLTDFGLRMTRRLPTRFSRVSTRATLPPGLMWTSSPCWQSTRSWGPC